MKILEITNKGRHELRFEKVITCEQVVVNPGATVKIKVADAYVKCYNYLTTLNATVKVKDLPQPVKKGNLNEVVKNTAPLVEEKVEEKTEPVVDNTESKKVPKKRKKVSF